MKSPETWALRVPRPSAAGATTRTATPHDPRTQQGGDVVVRTLGCSVNEGRGYNTGECPSRSTLRLVLDVVGVQVGNVQWGPKAPMLCLLRVILILPELSCLGTLLIAEGPRIPPRTRPGSKFLMMVPATIAYPRVPAVDFATVGHAVLLMDDAGQSERHFSKASLILARPGLHI